MVTTHTELKKKGISRRRKKNVKEKSIIDSLQMAVD
jgi:hypothetical protein